MIKIESRVLGPVATNCYLIINLDNNESIIVDPADSPESIYDMVVRSASRPQAILLTHGHFDHIGAANEVREHYGIKIYASCDEEKLLASPARNLSNAYGMSLRVTADVLHNDGDILELAGLKIKAIHTPGHTAGGTCYYIESDKTLCEIHERSGLWRSAADRPVVYAADRAAAGGGTAAWDRRFLRQHHDA